ncbi:MAG: hypothetical protein ACFFB5_06030 [Promethearchaeota archaeon]
MSSNVSDLDNTVIEQASVFSVNFDVVPLTDTILFLNRLTSSIRLFKLVMIINPPRTPIIRTVFFG